MWQNMAGEVSGAGDLRATACAAGRQAFTDAACALRLRSHASGAA